MQFHYQQKDRNKKVEINLLTLLRLPKISNQWEEYKWEPEEHSVDTWLRYMQCTGLQIRGRCLSCKREWVFEPWLLYLTWLSLVNHFTLNQAELVWTASLTIDLKLGFQNVRCPWIPIWHHLCALWNCPKIIVSLTWIWFWLCSC